MVVIEDDLPLNRACQGLKRLEEDVARSHARSGELSRQFQTYRALADACRDCLARHGWREDGVGDFIGGTVAFGRPEGARPVELPR
jgi:hypothetical protein